MCIMNPFSGITIIAPHNDYPTHGRASKVLIRMSVFSQATDRIPGITISLGETVNIPTDALGRHRRTSKHVRSVSEANKLPPAVSAVPEDHIRGYIHSKRVNSYLVGSTLGEGSFAKVKEGFHVLVGEKVSFQSSEYYNEDRLLAVWRK